MRRGPGRPPSQSSAELSTQSLVSFVTVTVSSICSEALDCAMDDQRAQGTVAQQAASGPATASQARLGANPSGRMAEEVVFLSSLKICYKG